jgi:hypothetical protein
MRTLITILIFSQVPLAFAEESHRGVTFEETCNQIVAREGSLGYLLLNRKTLSGSDGHTILIFGDPQHQKRDIVFYRCDGSLWDYTYSETASSIKEAVAVFNKSKADLTHRFGHPTLVSSHLRSDHPYWLRLRALATGEEDLLDVYFWESGNIDISLSFSKNEKPSSLLSGTWVIDTSMHRNEGIANNSFKDGSQPLSGRERP